ANPTATSRPPLAKPPAAATPPPTEHPTATTPAPPAEHPSPTTPPPADTAPRPDRPPATREDPARALRLALLWLAAGAVVLPALAATGWGVAVIELLIADVPGAGLLRDTQKYVALAVPGYALCAAAGCLVLTTAWRRRAEVRPALVGAALVAVLVVP